MLAVAAGSTIAIPISMIMSSITITGQQTDESLDTVGAALAQAARQIERGVFGLRAGD